MEATGQYRKLFKLYALPGTRDDGDTEMHSEKVDIREVSQHICQRRDINLEDRF